MYDSVVFSIFTELFNLYHHLVSKHFHHPLPGGSDGKESARSAGDLSSIRGSGRSPGEGNGYPLQYSCLEDSVDRGAWGSTIHGVTNSWT